MKLFLVTLLFLKITIFPNASLLIYLSIAIILDFITGVIKACFKNEVRSSSGFRKTVIKFMQYGGSLAIGLVLSNASDGHGSQGFADILHFMNDGLIVFIIYIETTSVFENLYAIDKTTMFSRYIITPILKILTFQIKNNPLIKQAENTETK